MKGLETRVKLVLDIFSYSCNEVFNIYAPFLNLVVLHSSCAQKSAYVANVGSIHRWEHPIQSGRIEWAGHSESRCPDRLTCFRFMLC